MHLAMNVTNLFILETVRRHYLKEYEGIVTNTGPSSEGWLKAPSEPGLGVDLASFRFFPPRCGDSQTLLNNRSGRPSICRESLTNSRCGIRAKPNAARAHTWVRRYIS